MKKVLLVLAGLLALIILLAFVLLANGCGMYNGLVTKRQQVDSAWANVQNVYQRRADLIPNLVSTVQGAANFEKSTLVEVTEARQQVTKVQMDPNTAPSDPAALERFQKSQEALSGALSRLLVTVEKYPDIKANQNFQMLQVQLEGTENRIAVERRNFNGAVQSYNTAIQTMPQALFAGALGFQAKPYFAAQAGAETAPQVNFNFGASPSPAR